MAQLTLSDYITIKDSNFKLKKPENLTKDFSITLPDTFVKGTNNSKPIIQFRLITHKPTELTIFINSNPHNLGLQLEEQLGEHKHWRTMYEMLNGNLFKPGETNIISFRLGGNILDTSTGDITISDILLTYQQKINL